MSALLRVRGLVLQAAGRVLMREVGFAVQPGERWVVIGRNAAGKSTLLRALAGLAVPGLSGDIQRHACAWLPQQANDRFDLRVSEYLDLHQQEVDDAALHQALDIAHLLDRPITQLSGGERQRVGLAGVARRDVGLWLLDEPVSFQDPSHQQELAHWLCAQSQVGVVLSAHDMSWVSQVATHVIALTPTGAVMGESAAVLNADVLYRTFACGWKKVQGRWLAA